LTQHFDGCDISGKGLAANAASGLVGGGIAGKFSKPSFISDTYDLARTAASKAYDKTYNTIETLRKNVTQSSLYRNVAGQVTSYVGGLFD
jgi:hypothetical protein